MSDTMSAKSELFEGRSWIVMLRGLIAVAFGLLAVAWPGITLRTLVMLFGIYALLHGALSLAAAAGHRGQRGCMLLVTEGIVGVFAGISTLQTRGPSPMAFALLVWLWAIVSGVLRIAEAFRLRKSLSGDVWLMLSGVATVLFGGMIFLRPIIGTIGLALLISISALIWGVFEILLGWEIRSVAHHGRTQRG
jgi:uncharacterized membrane protein HdeD (DUF308 family)